MSLLRLLRDPERVRAALAWRLTWALTQFGDVPQVANLTKQLQTLGFTEAPLADLAAMARKARSRHARSAAAIELARWHLRPLQPEGAEQALIWVAEGLGAARDPQQARLLRMLQIRSLWCLDRRPEAEAVWQASSHLWSPDLALAGALIAPDLHSRIDRINSALDHYGIAPVALGEAPDCPPCDCPPYDRLRCAAPPAATGSPTEGAPLVSVILAAYEADATLQTAIGSLQAQSWRNLEILVVDDASPSGSTARIARPLAAADPRIRLIEMPVNGGAYIARNRGLDLARGAYVTLHDADDWSHPQKIAAQVAFLQAHPAALGCTSEQARATDGLEMLRWGHGGRAITTNFSSLMLRRDAMRARFGYWDTLRLDADNELIRRIRAQLGARAVRFLPTGPLSFQRDTPDTMTSDPVLGISGFRYGARQAYQEAFSLHHALALREGAPQALRYTGNPGARPFPAPGIMQPDRARIAAEENDFDVVLATDFRLGQPAGPTALADALALRAAGLRVAVFPLYRYLGPIRRVIRVEMDRGIRQALQDRQIRILCHGERVRCRHLLIHDPACVIHPQRYLPEVTAGTILLVADPEDPLRADACARLWRQFGNGPNQGAANQGAATGQLAAGQTAAGQTAAGDGAARIPILSCPTGMAARQAVLAARASPAP